MTLLLRAAGLSGFGQSSPASVTRQGDQLLHRGSTVGLTWVFPVVPPRGSAHIPTVPAGMVHAGTVPQCRFRVGPVRSEGVLALRWPSRWCAGRTAAAPHCRGPAGEARQRRSTHGNVHVPIAARWASAGTARCCAAGGDVRHRDPWSGAICWCNEELMWTAIPRVCAGVKEGSQWEQLGSRALMWSGLRRRWLRRDRWRRRCLTCPGCVGSEVVRRRCGTLPA